MYLISQVSRQKQIQSYIVIYRNKNNTPLLAFLYGLGSFAGMQLVQHACHEFA